MQDYADYKVMTQEDRRKLFSLLQVLKRELDGNKAAAPQQPLKVLPAKKSTAAPSVPRSRSQSAESAAEPAAPAAPLSGIQEERIKVCVRKRPLFRKEAERGDNDVINSDNSQSMKVLEPKVKVDLTKYTEEHDFYFDEVLDEDASNQQVYARCGSPLVRYVLERQGKATCFAYGQTGSGKTHTMMGNPEQPGLYFLAADEIFRIKRERGYEDLTVWVSFFEIYGGKLYDLLNDRRKLVARADAKNNVNIVGLQETEVGNVADLMDALNAGHEARSTAATGANMDSSRSHAVLQICFKRKGGRAQAGKLSFIDLAGSERASDVNDNDRQTRIEGAEINKSLLALKECIRALDQNSKHVPFRGSTLTSVLKDSFIGNCRTVMCANVSPGTSSCEHTMNTLRYANRVKQLKGADKDRDDKYNAYMPHQSDARAAAPVVGQRQAGNARITPVHVGGVQNQNDNSNMGWAHQDQRRRSKDEGAISGGGPPANMMGDVEEEELARSKDQLAYEELVGNILEEEDDVVACHRQQIEDNMALVQEEMGLLTQVEMPGGSVESYVVSLDRVLERKMEAVNKLRTRLHEFQQRLTEEEKLSKTCRM